MSEGRPAPRRLPTRSAGAVVAVLGVLAGLAVVGIPAALGGDDGPTPGVWAAPTTAALRVPATPVPGASTDGPSAAPSGGASAEPTGAPSAAPSPGPSAAPTPAGPPIRRTREGFAYVSGPGPTAGSGRLRTYRVEVEPRTGLDVRATTALATRILSDPRGWTGAADWRLRRVARGPDIRIVIASPATVDRLCALSGHDTAGRLSCFSRAIGVSALNVRRWRTGTEAFPGDLWTYRRYLLNHEFGHALGYGAHEFCPRAGAPAPIMQQQSKGTAPCRPNGWPANDP